MTEGRRAFDGRVLAGLLVLNLVAHFVPFERPGFQTDDFMWLHHSRVEPEWSFVPLSLSQETRPLGWLFYILMPKLVGLHEGTQIVILLGMSSLLTFLVYLFLSDALPGKMADIAALAFVVWPVKHEIYSSQVVGVGMVAAALIVASALLYGRWVRSSGEVTLMLSVACYALSIFTYELGYLAPVVFHFNERGWRSRFRGLAWFLIPAVLYWVFRFTHAHAVLPIGEHPLRSSLLANNLLTSLPSNLVGFQVARNLGYGLFGLLSASPWFIVSCLATAWFVGVVSLRWLEEGQHDTELVSRWRQLCVAGLASAALLALPAAMVLVESRHSVLASAGIGVAIAAVLLRVKPTLGAIALVVLLLAAQGLAWRQAEASRLQEAVRQEIEQRQEEIRKASVVIFDMASLADRVPYTWGERETNVLRSYWGIFALSSGGFSFMVDDALYRGVLAEGPRVATCATRPIVSVSTVSCGRSHQDGRPFSVTRPGTLVIDFNSMPLPLPGIH